MPRMLWTNTSAATTVFDDVDDWGGTSCTCTNAGRIIWTASTATTTAATITTTNATGDAVFTDWIRLQEYETASRTAQIWHEWNDAWPLVEHARAEARRQRRGAIQGAPAIVQRRPTSPEEVQAELRAAEARAREEHAQYLRRLEDTAARRRLEERRIAAQSPARQRAELLLLDHLDEAQRADLKERDCFYLHLSNGRRYRIDRGTHGNVKLIDESGSIQSSFCAQPNGVPAEDAMLAQKLALETDEAAFLAVANETRWRR